MLMFLVLIAILAICISFILYGRSNYGLIESGNIPVVKPSLFLGSEPDFHKKVHHLEDIKRFKKYGPIWGVYVGNSPQVHIADPELIRLTMVKDFDYFHNRRDIDFGNHLMNEVLDFLPGNKWKFLRSQLSPLFTSSKLTLMSHVIANCAEEFIKDLKSESINGRINVEFRGRISTWLIDMFSQSTLGVRMADAKDTENEFASSFRKMMGEGTVYNFLYTLSLSFPFLTKISPTFDEKHTIFIEKTFRSILDGRRQSGETSNKDFVDILNGLWAQLDTPEFKELSIKETTIISQAVNFFLGGYETSTVTLVHLFLSLAKNPDIQEKMQTEIDTVTKKFNGKINHESIGDNEIPYTTACIKESLRLYPPFMRPERICTKDWTHNGITVKKGTCVMVAAWAANRNPEFFPDPEKFDPERFMPENKDKLNPYAFTTFGHGPRNCIGMRFAYESLKLLTCNILKEFRIELRSDTKLNYKAGNLIMVGLHPLNMDLVARK